MIASTCFTCFSNMNSTTCPLCRRYNKYSGFDFCCLTCRDTKGANHGIRCLKKTNLSNLTSSTSSTSSSNLINPFVRNSSVAPVQHIIRFYHANQPYFEFTNFYPSPIIVNGKRYPTAEHYFQSMKFSTTRPDLAEVVRMSSTPRDALNLSRAYNAFVDPKWHNGMKDYVMREALNAKFTQHPNLKALLLSTGQAILVEHTANDNYWGDGGNGTGQNMLGRMLMELRARL